MINTMLTQVRYLCLFFSLIALSAGELPVFAQGMDYIMPSSGSEQAIGGYIQQNNLQSSTGYRIKRNELGKEPAAESFYNTNYSISEKINSKALTPAMRAQTDELINKGYALSKSGQNEQAVAVLKEALTIDPSSSIGHLDMSLALIALKRYDEALHESEVVLQINPNDEKGYLNYLASAIGANRMSDALRVGQDYLRRFPNGENRTKLTNEMFAIEHEMDRRARAKGVMPPPGSPDNYLFFATPYGKRRWVPYAMPLKVFIYPGIGYKGFTPNFESILIKSFLAWQNATRGLVRFVPVADPRMANIECRWTDSAAGLSLAAEAGDAQVLATNNAIYHASITLLTCRPDSPAEVASSSLMQQVCLHEIGHALGLDGHSDSAQDIMYCATDPNVESVQLSQRDLNTLFLLYQ